ncbi:MAG: hypothetical protein ABIB79_00650 [archaeon]
MKKRKRSLNIHLSMNNRVFYTLVSVGILIVAGWAVFAFNSGGPAGFVGHSAEELDLGPIHVNSTSGNVGIGTTSPKETISLGEGSFIGWEYTDIEDTNYHMIGKPTGQSPLIFSVEHTTDPSLKLFQFKGRNGVEKLAVYESGNVRASGTICDSTGCIGSGGGGSITLYSGTRESTHCQGHLFSSKGTCEGACGSGYCSAVSFSVS